MKITLPSMTSAFLPTPNSASGGPVTAPVRLASEEGSMRRPDDVEWWARWMAERFSGVTVRRDDEPVDVARVHRDLATELVDLLGTDEQRAVETLRWVADRYAATLAGRPVRDADECLERARIVLETVDAESSRA
jgi:hypothetical protein